MMVVFRTKPLPTAVNKGQIIVPERVAAATLEALCSFVEDGERHEGLVYLAGRQIERDFHVITAIVPRCVHTEGSVHANVHAIRDVSRAARKYRSGVIAQVHSHPGSDTRHSDGDDDMVLMPFEGMFSIVVANYGHGGITPSGGAGVHQHQDGKWCHITAGCEPVLIVPTILGQSHVFTI